MIIQVEKINESQLRVYSEDFGIEQELSEYFKFRPNGYQFVPSFKIKAWDGWLYLYSTRNKTLPYGLLPYVKLFAEKYEYQIELSPELLIEPKKVTRKEVKEFIDSLNICSNGNQLDIRDYQYEAVYQSLNQRKLICESPTSSGKSMIIYAIIRFLLKREKKIVLTVPTTSLVNQMFTDFEDYSSSNGFDVSEFCHMLYSGKEKITDHPVLISTYQTLHSMSKSKVIPKSFFTQWNVLIGDECLHPETEITMSDGTTKKIKYIVEGDLVLTLNEYTKKNEINKVLKLHNNLSVSEKTYKIKTKYGKELIITGNHKIMTDKGWKETQNLNVGDKLLVE